jgi:hypothetical protein
VTDYRLTQIAIEEWARATPDERLTQAAIEEWATVASGPTPMLITQAALEQWASVSVVISSVNTFATQQVLETLSITGAAYVFASQIVLDGLVQNIGPVQVRATQQMLTPLVRQALSPARATQIMLEVITRTAAPVPPGTPRLWLLRPPKLHFIGPVGTTFP